MKCLDKVFEEVEQDPGEVADQEHAHDHDQHEGDRVPASATTPGKSFYKIIWLTL